MITHRTSPPFRAEHLGSLKRPDAIVTKTAEYEQGICSLEELKRCEDEAIAEAVKLQKDLGLRTITDGEFRRKVFWEGMLNRVDGMTFVSKYPAEKFSQIAPTRYVKTQPTDTWICTEKLRRTKPLLGLEFEYLTTLVGPEEIGNIKMTLSPPAYFHWALRDNMYVLGVYEHIDEYWTDVVDIYRREIADLYERGCRNIQIDDPYLTFFADTSFQERMSAANISLDEELDKMINILNRCLRGRKEDMRAGIHLCRGNAAEGTYYATGSYESLAAKLFNELDVDVFYLEYDNERSGDFEPLRYFPPNKLIVLGLITTKHAELEGVEGLKRRIYEAAEVMARSASQTSEQALDRICISPQCGFASMMTGNRLVSQEDLRKKIGLLTTVANEVWG